MEAVNNIEIVLCLPTHWKVSAQHKLCQAVEGAIRRTWIYFRGPGRPISIFTVREPEAGANAVLELRADQLRVSLKLRISLICY
jgi:hypothetical protein